MIESFSLLSYRVATGLLGLILLVGCAQAPPPPPGSGLKATGKREFRAPDDWLYETKDGRLVTLRTWQEEVDQAQQRQAAQTHGRDAARVELARQCVAGASPLWARFVIAETPDDALKDHQRCPAPDQDFIRIWERQPVPTEIVNDMVRCLGSGRGRAACQADALPRIESAKAAARARLPATGTFFGATAKTYKTAEGCKWFETERLTLDIDDWGRAGWFAHLYIDADCPTPSDAKPLTCARAGIGRLDTNGTTPRLVTEQRTTLPAPTLNTINVWKCGRVNLRMPSWWTPDGELARVCLRTGEEPDRIRDDANAAACQFSQIFPELDAGGVPVLAAGRSLVLQLPHSKLALEPGILSNARAR